MAVTKLSLYNDALLLAGERSLSSDSEDIPSRYELDTAYDNPPAASYCLELTKPKFSLLTAKLANPATPTNHALAYEYSFPADYIAIHTVFSEAELDEPIHRYIIEKQTLACDVATNIWLRYVSDAQVLTVWTPTFAGVVSAYLAKQIAPRIAPQKLIALEELFLSRVNAAITLEGIKEEEPRPRASTATLSNAWRKIYNKAFFILGLDEITTNNDDSLRRIKADVVIGTGLVATVLEDTGWTFALTSSKLSFDPSLEPEWGFNRVYTKPNDMHRLDGIYTDNFFQNPLKDYIDEGDLWYCGLDEIFVQYVNTSFLTSVDDWPRYFANVLSGEIAVLLAPGMAPDFIEYAEEKKAEFMREAASTDAMSGPPQRIRTGSWVDTRFSNRRSGSYNQRP